VTEAILIPDHDAQFFVTVDNIEEEIFVPRRIQVPVYHTCFGFGDSERQPNKWITQAVWIPCRKSTSLQDNHVQLHRRCWRKQISVEYIATCRAPAANDRTIRTSWTISRKHCKSSKGLQMRRAHNDKERIGSGMN